MNALATSMERLSKQVKSLAPDGFSFPTNDPIWSAARTRVIEAFKAEDQLAFTVAAEDYLVEAKKQIQRLYHAQDRDSQPLACDRDIVTGPTINERDSACQCGSRFTWTDYEGTEHCVWCASRGRSEGCLYAWLDNQDRWHCCGCDPAPSPGHPLRFAVARFVKAVTLPPFIPGCEFAWDEFRPVKL